MAADFGFHFAAKKPKPRRLKINNCPQGHRKGRQSGWAGCLAVFVR